jgi:PKD repeat protein
MSDHRSTPDSSISIRQIARCAAAAFLAAVLVLCCGVPSASALWPPLQDYTLTPDTYYATQLQMKVFDPQDSAWHIYTTPTAPSGFCYWDYEHHDGVVSYTLVDRSTLMWRRDVYAATYDPGDKQWRVYTSPDMSPDYTYWEFSNAGGVFAFTRVDRMTLIQRDFVYALTYDPASGQWRLSQSTQVASGYTYWELTNTTGVVAYTRIDRPTLTKRDYLYALVYDAGDAQWHSYTSPLGSYYILDSVQNSTVYYTLTGQSRVLGYHHDTHSWSVGGPTPPTAHYVTKPTSGMPPLWVWFTDMSIAGASWNWTFGGAGSSSARSPSFTFTSPAFYSVNQAVSGPAGSDQQAISVQVGTSPALFVSPSTLTFDADAGGTNPASQAVEVSNGGTIPFDFQATENTSWLSISPSTGGPLPPTRALTVSVDIAGLTPGTYETDVTVTAPGAASSPQSIHVVLQLAMPVGVDSEDNAVPSRLALRVSSRNLSPSLATIEYDVPQSALVSIVVYDATARQVTELVRGLHAPGRYTTRWNGRSARGVEVASGIYFVRLEAGGRVQTRKIVLTR